MWLGLLLSPSALAQPAAGNVDLARQRFLRGLSLYDGQQFEPALTEFQASTALYASPNSHLYAARCFKALGRLGESVTDYERTIGLASDRAGVDPRYEETREAARAELGVLEPQVGRIQIAGPPLPPEARITVGDRDVPGVAASGLSLPVTPGMVRITASAPGHASLTRVVLAAAGQVTPVELRLEPGPAPRSDFHSGLARPVMWTAFIVGAVCLGSFATFYALARREHALLDERCGPGPCKPTESDAIDRGRRYQTLTNVSLVVGLVGVLGGVTLWTLSPRPAERTRVAVSFTGTGLRLDGRF